ncbi:hypothetical protein ACFLXF_03780 [Chloroflexota bacterium]
MTDEEQELTDEPGDIQREQEGLKQEKENLVRELKSRSDKINKLEQALAEKESELLALKQSMADAEKKLNEVNENLAQAVASYKSLIVVTNPGVLAELITGSTVGEVDESLNNAQALVERVKKEMEAEASKTKIPAGSPQRAPLDLSALSAREKIQYAIGGRG